MVENVHTFGKHNPFQFILPIGYEAGERKGGGRKHGNPIRNLSADDTPAVGW